MQMEVVSRIKSAVAASSEKRCDTMVVLAFGEMTIKGKCYDYDNQGGCMSHTKAFLKSLIKIDVLLNHAKLRSTFCTLVNARHLQ